MYEVYSTSKYVRELRSCENENWKTLHLKIKEMQEKQWPPSKNNYPYNNMIYDDISKISFQDQGSNFTRTVAYRAGIGL